ncbi:MAG: efflux RND transporter periplasmic adaptor subunit [Prevotella sp.]|jgi:HlyD family secretion protein|uniref:efflux RND transporter periplasmic adaptor subunit n=1 Tax=Prevotella sp. E13-27 TaxID=2938122 RepID=UPI00200B8353|nr:efflux RND transporter periplasmic adaptor subunit [Prevotella sp. E13-27]MBQ7662408.1 efflux RND transporter periplasmic adaptor subunit [Prevotella sp.]MBR4566228.1 efflux RND transporter periplasmic adaptor subunit [Prevotella sp.]MCK8620956.1 efflux RND transporter periplasmic adaptor subunit [Prevotella sp. E13-27]MCR5818102.1 efflux RND transporter periplasmic adaptor subunit [Prevotella sp.]
MKKYTKLIVAAVVALIFIGTFVFLWQKSQPKEIVYNEFKPEKRDIQKTTVITGTIEPRNEVNIKPQISGIIAELMKEPGQTVQAGEVIAKVKVIPDMTQLSSAESRVRLSEINLKQVETDYARMENLHGQKLISEEEFEKSRQQLRQAREEKAAADDALQVVRDGVSKSNASASSTLIRSTISGVILDIPVKVGNSVINSNTFNDGTTIATVANMEDLIFRGNIDETEVGQLNIGVPMKIVIGAMQDVAFDATLEYISPKATQNNGANQFEIKAAIKLASLHNTSTGDKVQLASSGTLRSGYSANAEIILDEVSQVLSVPESTIEFVGDSTFVFVLTDSTSKKRSYERKPVETGLSDGVNIEIKKGVKEGETIRGPQIYGEEDN